MKGIIGFQGLCIRCIIGVTPEERCREQEIYLDLKVRANFSECITTDNLSDTVSYVELSQLCTEVAHEKKFHLMETLANVISQRLFLNESIEWVWIRINKPSALVNADQAFIELERVRDGS